MITQSGASFPVNSVLSLKTTEQVYESQESYRLLHCYDAALQQ